MGTILAVYTGWGIELPSELLSDDGEFDVLSNELDTYFGSYYDYDSDSETFAVLIEDTVTHSYGVGVKPYQTIPLPSAQGILAIKDLQDSLPDIDTELKVLTVVSYG